MPQNRGNYLFKRSHTWVANVWGIEWAVYAFGQQVDSSCGAFVSGFCPSDQLAQNQLVLNALKGELRIEEGDSVLLRDAQGKARVLLVPF